MEENESDLKPKSINYIGFNYDSSFFSVGTDIGFQIYQTNPLNLIINRQLNGGIGLVKMLEKSNIFCLVGGGKYPRFIPNKLILWDDNNKEIKEEFRCNSFIINCYIKQNCIFIICPDDIILINLKSLKKIKIINTNNNPNGISSISNEPKKYMLALPGQNKGNILILDFNILGTSDDEEIKNIENLENKEIIFNNAHKGNINVLSLNFDGTKLASASDRGTLIRIFNIKTREQIGEFRRGSTDANIYSLNFSFDNSLLGLTSNHGSCHIFRLNKPKSEEKKVSSGMMGYISGFSLSGMGKKITKAMGEEYSWKKIEIGYKVKSFISFLKEDKNNIFIIDINGNYFSINLNKDSDPTITKKTKLI